MFFARRSYNHKAVDASLVATLRKRRERLARKVGDGLAYVFNRPAERGHHQRYRPEPDMFYLTGLTEPDCALVIKAQSGSIEQETIYCRNRDIGLERWNGEMLGPKRASRMLGIDDARSWQSAAGVVRDAFDPKARSHHMRLDAGSEALKACLGLIASCRDAPNTSVFDLRRATTALRMVKDNLEIERITASSKITAKALAQLVEALPKAKSEGQLVAELDHAYSSHGARHAFLPIVACGRNACVAHYVANASRLSKSKLVLVDTGAEKDGYASDATRVYPVGGRFSAAQRDIYQVVLAAQKAAIACIKPGGTMARAQKAASRALARGLVSLGICRGTHDKVMSSAAFADFYFHSIGHMLGIEVHDPSFQVDDRGKPLPLRPGMVVTVEPGLYLDDRKQVPREMRNTGVRIEDLVLVTRTGNKVLTADAPKATKEVEALFS